MEIFMWSMSLLNRILSKVDLQITKRAASTGVYDCDGLRSIHNHDFEREADFRRAYERGVRAAGNLYGPWRVHVAIWAAKIAAKLPGDFVECGVNRGFISSSVMEALHWNSLKRTFYLLDTFGGIEPRYLSESEIAKGALERNADNIRSGVYVTDIEGVRRNFSEWRNIKIIQGAVPETLKLIESRTIAYLHIDMNCAPPEVAALEMLWGRIAQGGVVLLDDYAYHGYEAQKIAMDAAAMRIQAPILSLPTGQGLIIKTAEKSD